MAKRIAKRQVATRNGSWIGDQVPFVQIAREEGQDQIEAPVEHLSAGANFRPSFHGEMAK